VREQERLLQMSRRRAENRIRRSQVFSLLDAYLAARANSY